MFSEFHRAGRRVGICEVCRVDCADLAQTDGVQRAPIQGERAWFIARRFADQTLRYWCSRIMLEGKQRGYCRLEDVTGV